MDGEDAATCRAEKLQQNTCLVEREGIGEVISWAAA
jgi:hypothetical protein